MININSYIKVNEKFIPIQDYDGDLPDPDYIEGAIELTVNGVVLIDKSMWDLVDQLWAYIINGLIDVNEGKEFKTSFPDQPIELTFTHLYNDIIKLSVNCDNETSVTIDKTSLFNSVFEHLEDVFNVLMAKASVNRDTYRELLIDLCKLKSSSQQ